MGTGVVTRAPHIISSTGLGSCVAVALYDAQRKIGGLAHIMLPDSAGLSNGCPTPYRCADTAITALLDRLRNNGTFQRDIIAMIVGGARMFSCYEDAGADIGEQNITSVARLLTEERIRLIGAETGGHHGRSVVFDLDSGSLVVTAIGQEPRTIGGADGTQQ